MLFLKPALRTWRYTSIEFEAKNRYFTDHKEKLEAVKIFHKAEYHTSRIRIQQNSNDYCEIFDNYFTSLCRLIYEITGKCV